MVKARLPVAQIACVAIQSGARVMVSVGMLIKAGKRYSHTHLPCFISVMGQVSKNSWSK